MRNFRSVTGGGDGSGSAPAGILVAVQAARDKGCLIGRQVHIGYVSGTIIGYNISTSGCFQGQEFPLLVATDYGIAKFSLAEIGLD
jgi:hypothetical protein